MKGPPPNTPIPREKIADAHAVVHEPQEALQAIIWNEFPDFSCYDASLEDLLGNLG